MTYTFRFQDQIFTINLGEEETQTNVEIDGKKIPVEFKRIDENLYSIISEGKSLSIGIFKNAKKIHIFVEGNLYELESISERQKVRARASDSGTQEIISPMPSRVVKILKDVGEEVKVDEGVIVVEAMKMESELKSSIEGKVTEIRVEEGDAVERGIVLLTLSSD